MANIKIRELTDLEINERVPQNWLATATSEEAGLDRFTRRATWIDVFSGVAPIYSGEFNFGNFTGGLQVSGNDVLTGVPIATYTSLGVVQIGDNLNITEEGVLSTFPEYQLPPATRSELGGIIVGDTLDIEEDGTLDYNLPIAQKEDVSLPPIGGVIVGDNLSIDEFGVISATGNYILPTATETRLGGIKVGDHFQIKSDGELKVKEGSHTVTGVVKVGDTLTFTGDNYLSYELPPAIDFDGTNTRPLGGVIIGDNLTVSDGVLHGNPDYELPIASTDILGGIKVGDNLTIDQDGKLNAGEPFSLECATTSQMGGIKVGDYLTVDSDCKLSPDIMGGATTSSDGDPGIVPRPLKDSKDYIKVLRGDGSWVKICHTQTDAPINPKDGTLWFDTSVMELYVYVEGQNAWFQANGPACCGGAGSGGSGWFNGQYYISAGKIINNGFNSDVNWQYNNVADFRERGKPMSESDWFDANGEYVPNFQPPEKYWITTTPGLSQLWLDYTTDGYGGSGGGSPAALSVLTPTNQDTTYYAKNFGMIGAISSGGIPFSARGTNSGNTQFDFNTQDTGKALFKGVRIRNDVPGYKRAVLNNFTDGIGTNYKSNPNQYWGTVYVDFEKNTLSVFNPSYLEGPGGYISATHLCVVIVPVI